LGGSGSGSDGVLSLVEIAEELGKVLYGGPFVPANIVALALAQHGSVEQQDSTLPGILAGEVVATWCSAETTGQTDGDGPNVRASAHPQGYLLAGSHRFVQDAAEADIFLVSAVDERGVTQFLVPRSTPGVRVTEMASVDLSRRFAVVDFDEVVVDREAVVGAPSGAHGQLAYQRQMAHVLHCAQSLGTLRRVNEITFEYAKDRYAFGRQIGSFQAIKHKCVDMYLGEIGSEAIVAAAAEAIAAADPDAPLLAGIAKAYVGESLTMSTEHCHQVHGGISHTWDHVAHLFSRRATCDYALFGSPDRHKVQLGSSLGI
jgi:alkylation response protein AidB-like acyl-CoA dehydrogenase